MACLGLGLGLPFVSLHGGASWAEVLPSLRSFITANYNQPNPHNQAVMPSPPTVTTATSTPAQFTQYFDFALSPPKTTFAGGAVFINAGPARQFPAATRFSSGGNISGGLDGVAWRARSICDAQEVGIRVGGASAIPYRFIVDGRYVDLTGTLSAQSGTNRYYVLTFASKASRLIEIEAEQHLAYFAFALPTGDTITLPASTNRRMIVLGDSFTFGTGATRLADGFARVAGDMLGIYDSWCSGVSGSGYVATQGGTKYRLSERLGDANANGLWDIIVVAMGVNDIGQTAGTITSEVSLCLSSLRLANPAAQILVVGPWDQNAPAAPVANYATTKAAIQAGIPEGSGITFIDAEGVSYTKSDTLHPDTAGHKTLGDWVALQVKTALGA